jgi:serine/threonine-protein kinase
MKAESQVELDLFIELLELPGPARHTRLQEIAGQDPDLSERLNKLLEAERQSTAWFSGLSSSILHNQLNELEDYWLRGKRLGSYRIDHLIAQGGMGSVFLAKRDDGQFQRTVVIKIIPVGFDDESVHRRFANETSLLAQLQHPNIAQLFDAGETDDGRAYFVMEYVQGVLITEYCNNNRLDMDERLQLFLKLLHAVQFAHRHLVIHSDIKPSNVMVDKEHRVKLLDFGIAVSTRAGVGTLPVRGFSPTYVTPEQKKGHSLTTAVDIHQSGQLLFELLTGVPLSESGIDLRHTPLRPLSTWAGKEPEKLAAQAGLCSTDSNKLLRQFSGDMDAIVGKALAPAPEQRYDTADAFRRDIIARWRNQPVSSRPLTLRYRGQKYLRRNRVWVAAVSLILLLSLLFGAFMAWQVHETEKERNKAIEVTDLLIDAFQVANPGETPGRETTASEILDSGLARIRQSLSGQPDLQASLMTVIGRTYQNLGRYSEAGNVFQEALDTRRDLPEQKSSEIAGLLVFIAENERLLGHLQKAETLLNQALEIRTDSLFRADVMGKQGRIAGLRGDFARARTTLEQTLALQERLHGKKHLHYAQALNDLASIEFSEGKYDQAETLLREALAIRDGLLKTAPRSLYSPEYATNVNNLGLALFRRGKLDEAEKLFRRAIQLRKQIYLQPHLEQAQSMTNLGLLLDSRGKTAEALPYIRKALGIRLQILGENHMRIAEARNNLGMLQMSEEQFDAARTEFEAAFKTAIRINGIKHFSTATILNNLAQADFESGRYRAARVYYTQALEIRRQLLPAGHLYLSYSLVGLARTLTVQNDLAQAEALAREGLEIRQSRLPENHWLIGEAQLALGEVLLEKGRPGEALDHARTALKSLNAAKGESHYLTRRAADLVSLIPSPGNTGSRP